MIVSRSPSLAFLSLQLLKVCLAAAVKNVSPLLTCQTPNLNGSTVCQLFMVLDAGDIAPDINIWTTDRPSDCNKKVEGNSEWVKDCCCCSRYRSCYFSRFYFIAAVVVVIEHHKIFALNICVNSPNSGVFTCVCMCVWLCPKTAAICLRLVKEPKGGRVYCVDQQLPSRDTYTQRIGTYTVVGIAMETHQHMSYRLIRL